MRMTLRRLLGWLLALAASVVLGRDAGAGASACLDHRQERTGLRPRRHRSPACATPGPLTTCSRPMRCRASRPRPRAPTAARSWRRWRRPMSRSLKEFGFFTFAKADGKKQKFLEPVDYFLEYKDAALTLHFTLPLKAPVKAKQLALEVFDPSFFIDFKFDDKDPVKLVGAPANCKMKFQRPNDGSADAQEAQRAEFHERRQFQLRRDVRQQDHGGLPVTRRAHACARHCAVVVMALAAIAVARWRVACCCWRKIRSAARGRRRRRAAGRRHRRLAAGKAVGILSRDFRDHPRREVRRLGGLDAARDLLCLRHLPRRRPRPRQGGDLVLSGRQPGNRAARHRAVVRLGAAAGAGRGGRWSASAPGCSMPPPRPCAARRRRSRSPATA